MQFINAQLYFQGLYDGIKYTITMSEEEGIDGEMVFLDGIPGCNQLSIKNSERGTSDRNILNQLKQRKFEDVIRT